MLNQGKAIVIADEVIMNKIYCIRGHKVMIDQDLAELYGVETRRLKEQVKRNASRFPGHFMLELTNVENENKRSQNATLKQGAFSKYLSYAFTEHGVLMLSNVLKSGRAIEMSIKIIDIFVRLREILLTHKDILIKLEQLEKKVTGHDSDIQLIFKHVKQLLNPPQKSRHRIGFRRKDELD
jgi:phage regulator Rha-like protein